MKQTLLHISLVVRDYDEAIAFYTGALGFDLVEDAYLPEQDKRWVRLMGVGVHRRLHVAVQYTEAMQMGAMTALVNPAFV